MKNTVSGNPGENLLVIILEQSIHWRKLLSTKDVLEGEMQVQLKALLGSGGKGSLLGSSIVRELDWLVNGWEVDQRVKEADPVEATGKHLTLVDVLWQVITNECVLRWLNTFDSHCYVHYQSYEPQAEGQ